MNQMRASKNTYAFAAVLVCASCPGTSEPFGNWERFSVATMSCAAARAQIACEAKAPEEQATCVSQRNAVEASSPDCARADAVFGMLLADGDVRAKALREDECRPLRRAKKLSDEAKETLAACDLSGQAFSDAQRAIADKRKARATDRLDRIRAYAKREPTGFFDAHWGASAMTTAKEILARLTPGPSMGWQLEQIRKAAKGVRLENGYMTLTDKDGAQWFFSFDKENHLTGVIRQFPKHTLDALLAQCESEYGPAIDRLDIGHEATTLAMWNGAKANVECGLSRYGESHFPEIETTAVTDDDATK